MLVDNFMSEVWLKSAKHRLIEIIASNDCDKERKTIGFMKSGGTWDSGTFPQPAGASRQPELTRDLKDHGQHVGTDWKSALLTQVLHDRGPDAHFATMARIGDHLAHFDQI